MYYIEVGLGQKFKPLAMLFAVFGMVGCLGVFQSNQLAQLLDNQMVISSAGDGHYSDVNCRWSCNRRQYQDRQSSRHTRTIDVRYLHSR